MSDVIYHPIGIIHTPFIEQKGTPIQPKRGRGIKGTVEVFEDYIEGLADLDGFSHIILVYHLHKSEGYKLKVIPYLDNQPRGLFATRAPRRPNSIGLSTVRLIKIDRDTLHIEDLDILDGTPLLDIKPWVEPFDRVENVRMGWAEDKVDRIDECDADSRFETD